MSIGISVIICCFNSETRLPETLKYLAKQVNISHFEIEILVVDNASTDRTRIIAKQEWDKYKDCSIAFKIISQPVKGKLNAWHKASKLAKHEFLLTCDDDNLLHPNYLSKAFDIMNSNPRIGALGGKGIFTPEEKTWLEAEKYKEYYVNGFQAYAKTEHWVYGAGSLYRKSILQSFYDQGWKPMASGRTGQRLDGGEDVEICFMYYLAGFEIVASNELLFNHKVPAERLNIDYIIKMKYWLSYSHVLLNNYVMLIENDKRSVRKKLNIWTFYICRTLAKLFLKTFILRYCRFQNIRVNEKILLHGHFGTLSALIKYRNVIIRSHEELNDLLGRLKMQSAHD